MLEFKQEYSFQKKIFNEHLYVPGIVPADDGYSEK